MIILILHLFSNKRVDFKEIIVPIPQIFVESIK
jgi:hypothetical protein